MKCKSNFHVVATVSFLCKRTLSDFHYCTPTTVLSIASSYYYYYSGDKNDYWKMHGIQLPLCTKSYGQWTMTSMIVISNPELRPVCEIYVHRVLDIRRVNI